MNSTLILRIAVAITLFAHSIPTILSGNIDAFGNYYLNEIGFAPFWSSRRLGDYPVARDLYYSSTLE